jgi:hypothetical protein
VDFCSVSFRCWNIPNERRPRLANHTECDKELGIRFRWRESEGSRRVTEARRVLLSFDSLRSLRTFGLACHERSPAKKRQAESNGAEKGNSNPRILETVLNSRT